MSEAGEDDKEMEKAPEVEEMSAKANEDLARLCGSEEMAERVKKLWEDLMEKKRLDVSKQRLSDTEVGMLLKGLYSMARTTGFQTERMKPLPITELDFSGNELTAKGIDEVVQFARTAGANATLVDLSDNRLDDAATNELARLVKNYKCAATAPPPPQHRHRPPWAAGPHLASRPPAVRPTGDCAPLHASPTCCRPQLVRVSEAAGRAAPQWQRDRQDRSDQAHPVRCLPPPPPPATCHPSPGYLPTPRTHPSACSRPRYAHWERDRYKNEAEPPAPMKLDLSDNCVDHPAQVTPTPALTLTTGPNPNPNY